MFHLLIIIWHLIKRNERNDEENEKKNPCLQHFCLMKLWLSFLLGTCEILDRLTSETVSLGKKNCRQPNKMKQSHNRKSEFQSKMNNRRWEHKWNSHSRHANMFIICRNTHFYYWRIHFEIVKNHHFNSYKGEREKKRSNKQYSCVKLNTQFRKRSVRRFQICEEKPISYSLSLKTTQDLFKPHTHTVCCLNVHHLKCHAAKWFIKMSFVWPCVYLYLWIHSWIVLVTKRQPSLTSSTIVCYSLIRFFLNIFL